MARKSERKPKLTDAQRHARFMAMAKEVGASHDPKDFEEAFKKVTPLSRVEAQKGRRKRS